MNWLEIIKTQVFAKIFPLNSNNFFFWKLKDFEKTQAKNSISGISETGQCSESGPKKGWFSNKIMQILHS